MFRIKSIYIKTNERMKKNMLLLIALTFVSSVVWSGVVNLYTAPNVRELQPKSEEIKTIDPIEESKPKAFVAHVAHLNPEDNLYLLSIPAREGEKVEITILDEDNNVLYTRT